MDKYKTDLSFRVLNAKSEANRFLRRIKELEKRIKEDSYISSITGCKESGTLRRASLDLSRALSEMRKVSLLETSYD